MEKIEVLPSVLILIAAAVFVVILFKRLKLSPVLGYLVAGALIGDHGLRIVTFKETHLLAEFGVVFLLFAIGLELSFERLKAMRKYVLGLGSLQVFMTAAIVGAAMTMFTGSNAAAIIIGGGLALSSTAIVMQVIEENSSSASQTGRISLAILLQQDFIVVPLLVIVPLLAGKTDTILHEVGISFLKAILALGGIFITGRLFLRPLFGLISSAKTKSKELFVAATLLVVLSAAWGTEYLGLSMALGAFVSGVLVAETEFRHQAEESISPFKGLLLGLFFMSVGMTIDAAEIYQELSKILIFSISLILVKALIISGLCIAFGFSRGVSLHAGLLLSQSGEFAFILFNLGMESKIIDPATGKILLLVVTCTMALTPLLSMMGEKIAAALDDTEDASPLRAIESGTMDLTQHVIIAGFGKVGKMVARVLEAESINYIVLDINAKQVKEEEAAGYPIFKGDISQIETLKAAGAERAMLVILAIDNEVTTKKSLKVISAKFPDIAIIVRARDLRSASDLYESGATIIVPEDYETGLQLGGVALKTVGISEYEISRIKNQFRAGNYVMAQHDEDIFEDEEIE